MTAILNQPQFQDADKAREYLEAQVWPNGRVCPHCGAIGEHYVLSGKSNRPGLYKCADCREPFTVTVGTVFERSKIGLHIWLQAVHLMSASKKGVSAKQLERMLGVTYKTAWFMAHRIREAMKTEPSKMLGGPGSSGIVEADETTSNTAESSFAILKRGLVGTFHSVSEQHLQRYCVEFDFRWNTRMSQGYSDMDRANIALKGIAGKHLTYRRTHAPVFAFQ